VAEHQLPKPRWIASPVKIQDRAREQTVPDAIEERVPQDPDDEGAMAPRGLQ